MEPFARPRLEELDFAAVSPQEFAGLVRDTPKDELAALLAGPARERVLDEVFGRMRDRFKPDVAGRLRALVRWHVTGPGPAETVYETSIADGACAATRGDSGLPARLTLTVAAGDFLRLASGNAAGTTLFLTRRLKAAGDLSLAAGLTRYFDIPKA